MNIAIFLRAAFVIERRIINAVISLVAHELH